MSFIHHEPCPNCQSRDNLARYDDGHAFCFGCGYRESVDWPPTVKKIVTTCKPLPEDITDILPEEALQWLGKYGIMSNEYDSFLWSESRKYLIFPFCDQMGNIEAWQGRSFAGTGRKYFTTGAVSDIMILYGTGSTVILTEDVLSAIKVGRVAVGLPLFGSNIPPKLLRRLTTRFKNLGTWLDRDKAAESHHGAVRASQMGFDKVRTIITEKDPKEYTTDEISSYLEKYFQKG